jgi:hypothetical protein
MLAPVPARGDRLSGGAIHALARPNSAISPEAGVVRTRAAAMAARVEGSGALFGAKAAVIARLWDLTETHADRGWDGHQAAPVDRRAIARAVDFVRSLPDGCVMPEVGVDPDAAVSLDWITSRHRMLSISFAGNTDRLAYAWLDGTDRGHAVERFDGIRVPRRLLGAIVAVAETSDRASLRAA